MTRTKEIITVVVVSLAIAILAGEVYYRFISSIGYMTPAILKSRGLEYKPAQFARYTLPQQEQTARGKYYVNKLGYRGHDFSVEKPAGTIRVMMLGGSSVFDVGALDDEDWPHRVEQLLKARGFSNVEVINAGIIGYNSADSLGRFITEGHTFQPDYVFFFSAWNDLKYFKSTRNLLRRNEIYTESPLLDYNGTADRFLCEHSQVYAHLRQEYYNWTTQRRPATTQDLGHTDEINFEHLKQYRLNLELFVEAVRDIGAVPVLMTEPTLVARDNTDFEKSRIKYQSVELSHEQLCDAYQRVEAIVREVAAAKRVAFIDASKELSGRTEMFWDHGHLTMLGSETLAQLVTREFETIYKADPQKGTEDTKPERHKHNG
jgi:lysophospholipase L1-like esterase